MLGAPFAPTGCATTTATADERARRQAAIERWNRCVERQGGTSGDATAALATDPRRRVERGCEGYRRDVVNAFPPHMERRVEHLLDEGADRRTGARPRRSEALWSGTLVDRLLEVFSPG